MVTQVLKNTTIVDIRVLGLEEVKLHCPETWGGDLVI